MLTVLGYSDLVRDQDYKRLSTPAVENLKIDAECEEYGMDRMYFVKELVKLGLVAWKADEEELPEQTHRPATQP